MKTVLFTKNATKEELFPLINNGYSVDFLDVIQVAKVDEKPFSLSEFSLIFTSKNAVNYFFENGFACSENPIILAVGKKTALALEEKGATVLEVFDYSDELASYILACFQEQKWVHFCGNLALPNLETALSSQNIFYRKVIVYQTEETAPKCEKSYENIAFFSPSGVRSFLKNNQITKEKVFSIGQTTTQELLKNNPNSSIITSNKSSVSSVVELILKHTLS